MIVKKYLGKWMREEKSLFKKKTTYGDMKVEADSFAEAQQIVGRRMKDYDFKVALITPIWIEEEK